MATTTRRPPARRRSSLQSGTNQPARQTTYLSTGPQQASIGGRQVTRSGGTLTYASPGRQTTLKAPTRTYHRIILAEFIGCVVLVCAAPVLDPKTSGTGAQIAVDTSVSFAGPLVRLTAVCITFFVLALMGSGEKTGKIGAAFGGLVLAGAALTATNVWAAIPAAFGAAKTAKPAGAKSTTSTAASSGGIFPTPTGAAPAGTLPGAA